MFAKLPRTAALPVLIVTGGLVALACADAPKERPPATVLAATGSSHVIRAGNAKTATADGLDLDRTDALQLEAGARVVLFLHNGHVVLLDDEMRILVGELALMDAPPSTIDVDAALAQLTDKVARNQLLGARSARDRVAGFDMRRQAANVGAPAQASAPSMSDFAAGERAQMENDAPAALAEASSGADRDKSESAKRQAVPGSKSVSATLVQTPPAKNAGKANDKKAKKGKKKKAEKKGPQIRAGESRKVAKDEKRGAPADVVASQPPAAPDQLRALLSDATIKTCIAGYLGALPQTARPATLTFTFVVEADAVVSVRLQGGLTPPACVRDAVRKKPVLGATTRLVSVDIAAAQ